MTADFDRAKRALEGHTVALCKGEEVVTSEKRGVAPLLELLESGRDFHGYSAADKVVGKAAAVLFVKLGVKELYARTLSVRGEEALKKYGVAYEYGTPVEKIINRAGTDVCPMEKAVWDIADIEEGVFAINRKVKELNG